MLKRKPVKSNLMSNSIICTVSDALEGPTALTDGIAGMDSTLPSNGTGSRSLKKPVNDSMQKRLKGSKTKGNGRVNLNTTKGVTQPVSSSFSSSSAGAKNVPLSQPVQSFISEFLKTATAAQAMQVKMIGKVFDAMDADKDGLLSAVDVRTYFRAVGRNASDAVVRKWIDARDVDLDGAVSLSEFIAGYSLQIDSSSSKKGSAVGSAASRVSPVTSAFGALCLGNSPLEVVDACTAAEELVQRILDSPSEKSHWRVFLSEDSFHRRIGRLFGGVKVMLALGFEPEENGSVLALRDPSGREWDTLPPNVMVLLKSRLAELKNHEQALNEPSVSNVAAGITASVCLSVCACVCMHVFCLTVCLSAVMCVSKSTSLYTHHPPQRTYLHRRILAYALSLSSALKSHTPYFDRISSSSLSSSRHLHAYTVHRAFVLSALTNSLFQSEILSDSQLITLVSNLFIIESVSSAIGLLGHNMESAGDWAVAVETILTIISNILENPDNPKYQQINVANTTFYKR